MKRKYQKPYLAMEPYQLDASVAAACSAENSIPINYADAPSCAFDIFFGHQCAVDGNINLNEQNGFECYHAQFGGEYGLSFIHS